jgi:hypothetical protein
MAFGWFQETSSLISVLATALFRVDFHVYFVREIVSRLVVARGPATAHKTAVVVGVLKRPQ